MAFSVACISKNTLYEIFTFLMELVPARNPEVDYG